MVNKDLPNSLMIGSSVLYANGYVAVFGDEPIKDLVVTKRLKKRIPPCLYRDQRLQGYSDSNCDRLMQRVHFLSYGRALSLLSFDSQKMRLIKNHIKKIDATHLRFHTENGRIKLKMFDCRKLLQSHRLQRKSSFLIQHLDLGVAGQDHFSFTINSMSWMKLPNQDMNLRIGDNGICAVMPVNSNDETTYYLRDQRLVEPVVQFESPKISQDIVLVFHPKSVLVDPDTTQRLLVLDN